MPVVTIVQAYIFAALEHAVGEMLEDDTLVATIPELPGVIAYGTDVHECSRELYRLVEDTVRTWLTSGCAVPVIDDIDLNSKKGQILASYHPRLEKPRLQGESYEDEDELEAAFEARRKIG
jgi:hypothetical protein